MAVKIDYKKVVISTFLKMLIIIVVFFILDNWPQIKQSFTGNVAPPEDWFKETFKPGKIAVMLILTVYFFFRTYTLHKQLAEKRASLTP